MRQVFLIIAGFLLGYLLMNQFRSCVLDVKPPISDTVYKRDTVWKHYDTVVKKPMIVKKVIHDTLPPVYLPDPRYDSLKIQYQELAKDYLAKRIYEDTFKLASFGHVIVYDTVKANKLGERSYVADYMLPIIKDTIIITKRVEAPKKGQLYIGGGFASNKAFQNTGHIGVLYKTKKDKIVGGYVAVMPGMQISYGVQTYWKLSFKK